MRSERSAACNSKMHSARAKCFGGLTTRLPCNEEGAHATRRHAPPEPPARHRRTAVCAGAQRQQRWTWRRRQHCQAAAPAAARQGAQPLTGAAGELREAHASFPVRAVDVLSGGAADVLSGIRGRSRRPTDPSGTQQAVTACSLWVRVPGETLSQQCFQLMSRCLHGARAHAPSRHPASLRPAPAMQVHRIKPDDFDRCRQRRQRAVVHRLRAHSRC
jgi:hypothetical protein